MGARVRQPQLLAPFDLPFAQGVRTKTKMVSGKRTMRIDVVLQGTVTIGTADATSIINGGSLASLFATAGIEENGTDTVNWTTTMAHYLTQVGSAGRTGDVNLDSVAQGTYNLRTIISYQFRWPFGVAAETAYIEADDANNTFFWMVPNSDLSTAAGFLLDPAGTTTAAITNFSARVYQTYDDEAFTSPPYFVPRYSMVNLAVGSAGTEVPFYVRTDNLLRGICIEQKNTINGNNNVLADDIITSLKLLDDLKTYIGDPFVSPLALQMIASQEYAGDMVGAGASNFINFQQWGYLSKVYNPAQAGTNLRFLLNTAIPSGSSANQVNGGLIRLVRINGRTTPGLPPGMTGI